MGDNFFVISIQQQRKVNVVGDLGANCPHRRGIVGEGKGNTLKAHHHYLTGEGRYHERGNPAGWINGLRQGIWIPKDMLSDFHIF